MGYIPLVVAMTAKQHSVVPRAISLPFSLQLMKFIPNFTLSRAITYSNSLISDLISAWTNYTSEQLLSYLENKSLFVTCFVKINEKIIEIRQKTSDIFIVNKKLKWDISSYYRKFDK